MGRRTDRAGTPSDRALMKAREAGLSYAEIAEQFGVARSTVWKRLKKVDEALHAEADVPQTVVGKR